MTSRFAKLFLLIALLYALFTAGEAWMSIQMLNDGYDTPQNKIFQMTGFIAHWAMDPAFMCASAVMIEFLERIWRELAKRNASSANDPNV